MTANDVVLLAEMIKRESRSFDTTFTPAYIESYFTAKHYLRHYKPSHDDLVSGIVDGAQDGGVDAAYIFANGLCIRDDVPPAALGRNVQLDLVILQVKNTKGFSEEPIDKLAVNLPRLLDFGRDETALSRTINPRVIEVTRRFLDAYRSLDMPQLRIFLAFASLRADHLHPNTVEKSKVLDSALRKCFAGCVPAIEFVDASSLADMARDRPSTTRTLALAENPISTDLAGGYIGLVRLNEYEKFITGDSGELDAGLFEANVRDYEGDTSVNRSIQETLETTESDVDFWWLNNGVTIVATRVQPANKLLELDSPQIVNGLQTSNEIYKRSRAGTVDVDRRSVLVKVIEAQVDDVRDRIIRATNSQTALGPSSIRATDKVQRQIEEHLKSHGLFYERRRNHYQNQGIPSQKIVSIDQMGQALLSTLIQAPHLARGSLSQVFDDENYDLLFSVDHPITAYSAAISINRIVEDFLRRTRPPGGQIEDFSHHLTMLTAVALTRRERPTARELAGTDISIARNALLDTLLDSIKEEYNRAARRKNELLIDRIAKDPEVTKTILERGRHYLRSTPRNP